MERSRGLLSRRTRNLVRHKKPSTLTIVDFVKNIKIGDRVVINPKMITKEIPHPKYKGRTGIVVAKQGRAFVVEISIGKKAKRRLIVDQLHLEKLK